MILTISVILVILSGAGKACQDIISHKYDRSIFSDMPEKWQGWLNPKYSWLNKYRAKTHEEYLQEGGDKEAFFLSETVFVWVTDLWHMAAMIENTSLILGLVMLPEMFTKELNLNYIWELSLDLVLIKLCFTASFTLFYKHIFNKQSSMKKLNLKVYTFLSDVFALTQSAASRLLAFIYFLLIILIPFLIDLAIEDTRVWEDYDRFRFSYALVIILALLWIGWFFYMFFLGGKDKIEREYWKRFQESIKANE